MEQNRGGGVEEIKLRTFKIILRPKERVQDILAEIYQERGRQGKWLFNTDGTPYVHRSEKVQIPV